MALSIRNQEVEKAARELAKKTGESMTGAILTALRERLKRIKHRHRPKGLLAQQLLAIARRCASRPTLDNRSPEEIIGYDEHGAPGLIMVIDPSALVAILFEESECKRFVELLEADETRLLSAAGLLEAAIVIEGRQGVDAGVDLDVFLHQAKVRIVEVDEEQVEVARSAWRSYGKGNHPAGLNFGDCFSYALAKVSDEALLAKGGDFSQTDIPLVLA